MDIVGVIKERRKVLGVTQQDLAEMGDVSLATIKDIERGQGNPSLSTIHKILDVLGLEMVFQVRKPIENINDEAADSVRRSE